MCKVKVEKRSNEVKLYNNESIKHLINLRRGLLFGVGPQRDKLVMSQFSILFYLFLILGVCKCKKNPLNVRKKLHS